MSTKQDAKQGLELALETVLEDVIKKQDPDRFLVLDAYMNFTQKLANIIPQVDPF